MYVQVPDQILRPQVPPREFGCCARVGSIGFAPGDSLRYRRSLWFLLFVVPELLLELLDAGVLGCKFALQVLDGLRTCVDA
jgi:hypothetical protein